MQNSAINQSHSDKDFADTFGAFLKPLRQGRIVAHLASGFIEYAAIKSLIASSIESDAFKVLLVFVSVVLTIFVVIIIEGGISILSPILAGQAVGKKFYNWLYKTMFAILAILAIPLYVASPLLSAWGSEISIEAAIPTVNDSDLGFVDQEADHRKKTIKEDKQKDLSALNDDYSQKANAKAAEFDSKIAIAEAAKAKHKSNVAKGHKWAASHVQSAQDKILKIQADKASALSAIATEKAASLEKLNSTYGKKESLIDGDSQDRKKTLKKKVFVAESRRSWLVSRLSYFGWLIGILVSVAAIASYFIEEIMKKGAGEHWKALDEKAPVPQIESYFMKAWNWILKQLPALQSAPPKPTVKKTAPTIPFTVSRPKATRSAKPISIVFPKVETETETDYTTELKCEKAFRFDSQLLRLLSDSEKEAITIEVKALSLTGLKDKLHNSARRRVSSGKDITRAKAAFACQMAIRRAYSLGWKITPTSDTGIRIEQ